MARVGLPLPIGTPTARFSSLEAVARLLTPENRQLMALIRDHQPESLSELAKLSGRAQPSLTRTLAKLEAAGFVRARAADKRRKALSAMIEKVFVEIDPYSDRDQFYVSSPETEAIND